LRVVPRDHDFRHFDLPEWLHALSRRGCQGYMFVPQNLDGFCAISWRRLRSANRVHGQVEAFAIRSSAHPRRALQDHAVGLDGRDSAHLLVVGVAFVLGRNEHGASTMPSLAELLPSMAIEISTCLLAG